MTLRSFCTTTSKLSLTATLATWEEPATGAGDGGSLAMMAAAPADSADDPALLSADSAKVRVAASLQNKYKTDLFRD